MEMGTKVQWIKYKFKIVNQEMIYRVAMTNGFH